MPARDGLRAPRRRSEGGFSVIELVIVVIIIAIVFSLALPTLRSARRAPDGPGTEVAASALWRAVGRYRADYRGALPPTAALTGPSSAGTLGAADAALRLSLRSPSGEPYLQRFPSLPTDDAVPIRVVTAPAGATGRAYLVYRVSGMTGRLEAYDQDGRRRWCRSVETINAMAFQNGNGGRIAC